MKNCLLSFTRCLLAAGLILLFIPAEVFSQENLWQNPPPIELSGGWQYRWGDSPLNEKGNPLWICQDSSDTGWDNIVDLENPPGRDGAQFLWYRIKLPQGEWLHPTIYFPTVYLSFDLYIDCTLIYRFGNLKSDESNKYAGMVTHLIPIDNHYQGKTAYLRIFSDEPAFIGINDREDCVWFGSESGVVKTMFKRNIDSVVLGALFVFLGLFSLFIFFIRFRQREFYFFSFGIFTLFMGLFYALADASTNFLFSFQTFRYYLGYISFLLFPVGMYAFFENIFGTDKHRIIRRLWQLHLLYVPVATILDLLNILYLPVGNSYYLIFFAVTILTMFYFSVQYAFKGNREARLFVAGFTIAGLFGLHDIFVGLVIIPLWHWMAHWGSFIFVLFLGYILEQRFAENRTRLEAYARELEFKTKKLDKYSQVLEQKVAERTKDLNRKNTDLETTLVQLKEMQHQLITKEKMAMLGNLVAGIAHEVNNPMGVVNSAADVSSRCIVKIDNALTNSQSIEEIRNNSGLQKTLRLLVDNNRLIVDASRRVSKLVSSLKNFALLDEAEYKKIDLHEGIDNTLTLLEHEFKDRIEVIKEYGDIPPVHCYASQINQMLMNLLKNASQAIEKKGIIRIKTAADDKNIFINITDNGKGIPKDKLDTIFDIGFSASGSRVKMGSGLWTAHNIMHQHNGEIKIESEVGKGVTVTLMLPLK